MKAIEDRTVRRLGRTSSEPVDVGILAATNEELEEAVRMGRFRRDLYHRLAVVTLRLPPLRERYSIPSAGSSSCGGGRATRRATPGPGEGRCYR